MKTKTIDQLIIELDSLGIKLWLEDGKLRYRAAKGALNAEILTELKENKSKIISFLENINATQNTNIPEIVTIDRKEKLVIAHPKEVTGFNII
jgi:hypothetical protein